MNIRFVKQSYYNGRWYSQNAVLSLPNDQANHLLSTGNAIKNDIAPKEDIPVVQQKTTSSSSAPAKTNSYMPNGW